MRPAVNVSRMIESATIFVAGVFVLAGFVKGTIGLGLPTIAMGLLVLAKVATVCVPVVYGHVVDALAPQAGGLLVIPAALVIAYGLLRVGSAAFGALGKFDNLLGVSAEVADGGVDLGERDLHVLSVAMGVGGLRRPRNSK